MLKSINVISIFPEMFSCLNYGVVGRFIAAGQVKVQYWNPRDYADNNNGIIDDKPYGGGPGMVMAAPPLMRTLSAVQQGNDTKAQAKTVLLSPQGDKLSNDIIKKLVSEKSITLLCGRYEGIDQRVCESYCDYEVSLGDFVMSGGELAAMAMIDSMLRLLPGCLGNKCSYVDDSFFNGLLDHPHYTRPSKLDIGEVPAQLISGNHEDIENWRLEQSLGVTLLKRPELLYQKLDNKSIELLLKYVTGYVLKPEHSS